ncbi:unnamed protein product, partial [Durusdinium trenchii]
RLPLQQLPQYHALDKEEEPPYGLDEDGVAQLRAEVEKRKAPSPQSSMTRKSIGKVKASQFKKLKPGLRLTINQGFRKLRRMASALDISECEVAEVLETLALHLEENIEIASRDREVFIGELAIPEEPLVQE